LCNHKNPKKIIYICHPFRGDIAGNQEKVRQICKAIKNDYVPLAPHLLLPHYLNEETERDLALLHGLVLLRGADELWIVSEVISEGMQGEIEEARRLGIPVRRVDQVNPEVLEIL
jgi:hypothetical protein